ncbi:TonB-dependent receptor plug domain-containing protein [Bradyrhizobium sp. RDT10]
MTRRKRRRAAVAACAVIDGVPLGRIESGNTLSIFDLKAVDYIEVYRGANSLRYGALASGGAINLVSKTCLTAPGAAISGAFGSYGNLQGSARIQESFRVVLGHAPTMTRPACRSNYVGFFQSGRAL